LDECALMVDATIARQLVMLEATKYSGAIDTALTELGALCAFNLLLAERYGVERLPVSRADVDRLFEPAELEGLTVPRFVREVDTAMGGKFFHRTRSAKPHLTLGQYIAEFAFWCAERYFPQLKRFPPYLLTLLGNPVSWTFPSGPKDVPMALSLALSTAAGDPANPLAPENLPPGAEYATAMVWFVRWLSPRLKGYVYPGWLLDVLNAPSETVANAREYGISRLFEELYWSSPELRAQFGLRTHADLLGVARWLTRWIAPQLAGYTHADWTITALARWGIELTSVEGSIVEGGAEEVDDGLAESSAFAQFSSQPSRPSREKMAAANSVRSGTGVNLVGWARAEIGIGEDVRLAARALDSAGVPFGVIDAADRVPPSSRQADRDGQAHIIRERTHAADVVFLDALTQHGYYAAAMLRGERIAHPIIGVCPWELPQWPRDAAFAVENLDYFWAASNYILEAFAPHFPQDRISLAPPAVYLAQSRGDDLVPAEIDGPFRLLTIFDGLSSIHRKNPVATIRAFRLAFPRDREVRLTVKYMNLAANDPQLDEMQAAISGDARIEVVSQTMDKPDLVALVRTSHCFVSLHRAEGFGRNIAESMLLGRPVICSRFSGNLDFCSDANSFLVDGDLVHVGQGEYALSAGQSWFDPSVDHAAALMLRVRDNWEDTRAIAARGRNTIRTHHSLEAVGQRYRDLIGAMI
jgi:glycosyltransferase involved in cell wall biosynthesis